jgi:putative flippase GtrA
VDAPGPTPAQARLAALRERLRGYAGAIERADEAWIATTVAELARRKPWLAPLALALGGITMLVAGLRVLVSNWRLLLVQVLPAMWVWLAMYDLRLHLLRGSSLPDLRGPVVVPLGLAVIAATVASYFLNAAFAFAVAQEGQPSVRRAFAEAWRRRWAIAAWGGAVGLALAISTLLVSRTDRTAFVLSLGIVVGVMMVTYIAVPARMIGVSRERAGSRRDRLSVSALGAALGIVVSAPPYLLGRIGLLMLGSKLLLVPGIVVFAASVLLQAGATSAVKAIKVSAKLSAGRGLPGRGADGGSDGDRDREARDPDQGADEDHVAEGEDRDPLGGV